MFSPLYPFRHRFRDWLRAATFVGLANRLALWATYQPARRDHYPQISAYPHRWWNRGFDYRRHNLRLEIAGKTPN
jgi:hypothetical protein